MLYIKRVITLILISLSIISCGSVKTVEIPVETIKTEYKDRLLYDSIYCKDSIYIILKKDTIYVKNILYLYKYKYLKDTINIIDTVPKIVTVDKVLYINQLYDWLKVLMYIGIGFVLYIIFKLVTYIKTKV